MGQHWYLSFDWVGNGYVLYILGSAIYFVQALNPYLPEVDDPEGDDLYSYYEDGPFTSNHVSAWMSIAAAWIFVIESFMYIVAWYISRNYGDKTIRLNAWHLDWNHWGNVLFLLGSCGYVFTSYTGFYGVLGEETRAANTFIAFLFVVDSFFYLFAIIWADNSKVRFTYVPNWTFRSAFDWYFLATLLFIFGSFIYLVAALDTSYSEKEEVAALNLYAAIVFIIDSPLYYLSNFQERLESTEVDLLDRQNYFFIEHNANSNPFYRSIAPNLYSQMDLQDNPLDSAI